MTNAGAGWNGACARVRERLLDELAERTGSAAADDAIDAIDASGAAGAGGTDARAFEEADPERVGVEVHLAECAECAAFAAQQRALDARLAAAFASAPVLSAGFRPALRARVRGEQQAVVRQRRRAWIDALPDLVHFVSCGVATIACAVAMPASAPVILSGGTLIALATYVPLLVLRNSFEDVEPIGGWAR